MKIKEIAEACMVLARHLGVDKDTQSDFAMEIMRLCLSGDSLPTDPLPPPPRERVVDVDQKADRPATVRKRVRKMVKAARTVDPPKRLAKAGQGCVCSTCARPVYQTVKDVYDRMPAGDFAACFSPVGHIRPFPVEFRLRAIDGCVMTDCPVCDGDMTLVLWGVRPEKDFDDSGVSSVTGQE